MMDGPAEAGAFAQIDVTPSEAGGQEVAHVGDVEEEERHAHHGVDDRHHFAHHRPRRNVAITCARRSKRTDGRTKKKRKKRKIDVLNYSAGDGIDGRPANGRRRPSNLMFHSTIEHWPLGSLL
jgi:hypothetical protein